jgi:NAD(P)-dependent dehydrogenase (short-subunit alcohol dehydrogenase family)
MTRLNGRVAIVTGGGIGIGRAHALALAREGARVVVNDIGCEADGSGELNRRPAQQVADEISALGGEAIANFEDVTDFDAGRRLVDVAVEAFGGLDILVNNAGILRHSDIADMDEDQWDKVIEVNLKGCFVPTRWAARYWRDQALSGSQVKASIVHTSSTTAISGTGVGIGFEDPLTGGTTDQLDPLVRSARGMNHLNYVAAKAGVASFGMACASELAPYGVRSNVLCPRAWTRMANIRGRKHDPVPVDDEVPHDDPHHPSNQSSLIVYLAEADCETTGRVFSVITDTISIHSSWPVLSSITNKSGGIWAVEDLESAVPNMTESAGT